MSFVPWLSSYSLDCQLHLFGHSIWWIKSEKVYNCKNKNLIERVRNARERTKLDSSIRVESNFGWVQAFWTERANTRKKNNTCDCFWVWVCVCVRQHRRTFFWFVCQCFEFRCFFLYLFRLLVASHTHIFPSEKSQAVPGKRKKCVCFFSLPYWILFSSNTNVQHRHSFHWT